MRSSLLAPFLVAPFLFACTEDHHAPQPIAPSVNETSTNERSANERSASEPRANERASEPSAEPNAESEDGATEVGEEGDDRALPSAPNATLRDGSSRALLMEVDRELSRMRSSKYVHHTSINEANGVYDFDCSGFVGYALEGAAPNAWSELRSTSAIGRPLAKHFEAFFAALPADSHAGNWRRVARASDLEPGDVIAWLRPPDVTSKNTGHVVIVHGKVTPYPERPGAYLVPIVDATHSRHGHGDSRLETKTTGLGTGTILLITDGSGAPVAYRWSLGRHAREHAVTVAMGRLTPR
jgi:hypothetical protein